MNPASRLLFPVWLQRTGEQRSGVASRALRDEHGEVTFTELASLTAAIGAALLELGLEPGDRVATAMEPSVPHALVVIGAMTAGLVPAPLNTRLAPPELRRYADRLEPAAVVVDDTYADLVARAGVAARVVELGDVHRRLPMADRVRPLLGSASRLSDVTLAEDAPAIVFPTGGTTGTPKGAFHTHRSLWLWLNACMQGNPRTPTDVELFFSPFFHITLGINLLAPLLAGGEVWIQRRFEPGEALAAIRDGATRLMGAPTMFAAMRADPSFADVDRSRVTAIRYGSAPSSAEFVQGLLTDFPNARIRAGFAATEFGPATGFDHEDLVAGRFRGVGRALPGVRVRLVDDDGREVPVGEIGNVVVDSPWQMAGYWGMPEETAATFRSDGVHIGDLAYREPDGWHHIAGRKKEIIITGGENVFPVEVEEVVLRHAAVDATIVYGVADAYWGERVEAGVVLRPGATLTVDELRDYCRAQIAGFKIPKTLRLLEKIPLTANNKPDRRAARAASESAAIAAADGAGAAS